MKGDKFYRLMRTLTKAEFTAFNKYLKVRYPKADIPFLVSNYLQKFYPDFSDEIRLDPAYIHEKVFERKASDKDLTIQKTLSELYADLKDFLLINGATDMEIPENAWNWMLILKERGLVKESTKAADDHRKKNSTSERKDVADYLKGLSDNYFFYYDYNAANTTPDRPALQQCATDLDVYYVVTRLKVACEIVNTNANDPDAADPVPAILEFARRISVEAHPLAAYYLAVYDMLTNSDDEKFNQLKVMLTSNIGAISVGEQHTILSYLNNYAAQRTKANADEFWVYIHELNKWAAEKEIFSKKGTISSTQFTNIVAVACIQKDFNWADQFIVQRSDILMEKVKENTIQLSKAIVLCEKKKHAEALACLMATKFSDKNHTIRAKILTLMCYYPDRDRIGIDTITSYCTSFETYLSRDETIAKPIKSAFLRFIKIYKMILGVKHDKKSILKAINKPKDLISKHWLLEMALKNRN